MYEHPKHFYEFDGFRLNVTERLLQLNDQVVPLTPKVLDTLLILVENTGHVMGKDELMQALWPDSYVEESSLTQNISLLRRALRERRDGGQYIETVPKRGYRFVAEVREVGGSNGALTTSEVTAPESKLPGSKEDSLEPEVASVNSARRFPVVRAYVASFAGCVILLSAFGVYWSHKNRPARAAFAPRSIAVLPFKTIGPEGDADLMGLGMADALIIKLSRLHQASVLPTSSIFKYTNREKDALAIAKDLGVDAILDGTLQRNGDRVRVTAQLLDARNGKTVWAGKFDEQYENIFRLQDSLSEQMAGALLQSNPGQRAASYVTEDSEAYRAYLTGLYFWNKRSKDNLPKAIEYLEQSVKKDANFALAHAVLADCYYLVAGDIATLDKPEILRRANDEVTRALQLDENSAEAHTVKAGLMLDEGNFFGAEQQYRRAFELNPSYALAHLRYGYWLFGATRLDEAVDQMRRAQELDPVSPVTNIALAFVLHEAHDFDGAIEKLKKALELQPDSATARFNLGSVYVQKRRFAEAHAEFAKLKDTDPLLFAEGEARAYAAAGRRTEALGILSELLEPKNRERISPYSYAVVYAALGDKDTAFRWLGTIPHSRSMSAKLQYDPEMDSLRSDPRFCETLKPHLNAQSAR
jgi:DNA-binding winged helix-turn-helix (wHTH) protein/TolB-like protein/Flp pilus assembly protein TadD